MRFKHLSVALLAALLLAVGSIVTYGQTDANLRLIVSKDVLVIYVVAPNPVSLAGLQFRIVNDQGVFQSFTVVEGFDSLRLTDSLALPGACYVYRLEGADARLPSMCMQPSLVFIRAVAPVDVFWYDSTSNRKRDIAVLRDGNLTDGLCSANANECPFNFVIPTPTPTPAPIGFPGNPVIHNADWRPIIQSFDGVDMVLVPTGCFMMGSESGMSDEKPVHQQCFNKPFWIDETEVTNAQFQQFKGASLKPSYVTEPQRPRENITWFESRDFCAKRNGRLPTEREWEYAARGPDNLKYPWGNNFVADSVVYVDNSSQPAEVSSKPSGISWVGAFDMSGNVWEWVSTISGFPYPYKADDGRENENDPDRGHGHRGGSAYDYAHLMRAAFRGADAPSSRVINRGFRCARDWAG